MLIYGIYICILLALWIKQENLWQDYAEYLLQEKNAQAVSAKYTLEFTGEEWTYGGLFK